MILTAVYCDLESKWLSFDGRSLEMSFPLKPIPTTIYDPPIGTQPMTKRINRSSLEPLSIDALLQPLACLPPLLAGCWWLPRLSMFVAWVTSSIASGECSHKQTDLIPGSMCTAPERPKSDPKTSPRRESYGTGGWLLDRTCTGTPWFVFVLFPARSYFIFIHIQCVFRRRRRRRSWGGVR